MTTPEKSAWPGVDESVVHRFAVDSGGRAPEPMIDWVEGDLLLFAFLIAGLVAGFVLGFFGRALFVEGAPRARGRRHV